MPAFTSIALGVTAAAGAAKTISGASQAKKAQNAIDNFKPQSLDNVFENIQIPTIGTDFFRESQDRMLSTGVDQLRSGGTRAIMGGIPKLEASYNNANRQETSRLDKMATDLEYKKAQDDARIRQITERRETGELYGMGQLYNAGQQNMWNGIGDITSAAMYFGMQGEGVEDGVSRKDIRTTKKYLKDNEIPWLI